MRVLACSILLLAACGAEKESQPPEQLPIPSGPPAPQQPARAPAAPPAVQWETSVSPSGTELLLKDAGGALLMSVACRGEPPLLVVGVPAFKPVGSEDRLSFGIGNDPVALVADPAGQQPKHGVAGQGAAPKDFSGSLARGGEVSASYGAQQAGPYPAPPAAAAEALGEACA